MKINRCAFWQRFDVVKHARSLIAALLFCFCLQSGSILNAQATSVDKLRLPEGFKAELLYSVPPEQGSWVSMTTDPQGRLIASDQYGGLYRINPAGDGVDVEKIELRIGFAQGLLCAFDSLYVVSYGLKANSNGPGGKMPPGLYRVRDSDDDDKYDSVELLRQFEGKSEHGPHAVMLSPDKKSLYICAGNATKLPQPETSRVPKVWQEDQVLARLPDARGHAAGRLAPGGWVCKTDPEGKSFELVSMGFRNQYDIAFDPNGELFTFDADMEWDVGLPWYRPTRVCHIVSGSEFGWRHGSGKWPEYYPDNIPPVINIGPGSPTGITFGTGAKFPAKYQNALFIADWSYGVIYAVGMEADGASYKATKEKFCSAPALPITDMVINPLDQAMYFLVGGRRAQSALYRITYVGAEPTTPATYPALDQAIEARRTLESFHGSDAKDFDLDLVWEKLGDPDRFIRYAARTALEFQAIDVWAERALQETDPQTILESMMGLARVGQQSHQESAIKKLASVEWDSLSDSQRIHLIRAYGLALCRLGTASDKTKQTIVEHLEVEFPTKSDFVDRELGKLLIAADSEQATAKAVQLLVSPSGTDSQIAYAMMLSNAKVGWNQSDHEAYFQWFLDVANARGGNSFGGYINNIRKQAIKNLSDQQRASLAEVLSRKAEIKDPYADLKARPLVKQWKLEDLLPLEDDVFVGRDLENGRKMFALASCYSCHRISGQGGIVGPDLTPAGHRFSTKDLLEAIIDPSKEISDQYEATIFQMEDGKIIVGRVANLAGDQYKIQENMIDPGKLTVIKATEIEDMKASKVSMMPGGLLDNLTREEILDLLAYMKSTVKDE